MVVCRQLKRCYVLAFFSETAAMFGWHCGLVPPLTIGRRNSKHLAIRYV